MLPGGVGRGHHGCPKQDHPPATGRRGDDTPPRPTALVASQRKKHRQKKKKRQAVVSLPEGPLVEILSRVPYRSLCRFKCVSKPWLALCSDPDIRRRSPQTLSGFFQDHRHGSLKFRNLSGRGPPLVDPALPFLHGYEGFRVEQCCGGLLLCQCWKSCSEDEYDLVVCNPATGKWTVLPPINVPLMQKPSLFFLDFDMTVPSRFVVFVPLVGCLDDVAIYSSETGTWIRTAWEDRAVYVVTAECVFLNGFMHLTVAEPVIAAVHSNGDWRRIPLPEGMKPSYGNTSMGQSRGLLHAWYIDPHEGYQLSVWVLEDYDSDKWTLKHTVDVLELFHKEGDEDGSYEMFAIHPERNLIFITDGKETTLSYDMDNQEVHTMCTSGEFLGGIPYTPCFAEWFSDGL